MAPFSAPLLLDVTTVEMTAIHTDAATGADLAAQAIDVVGIEIEMTVTADEVAEMTMMIDEDLPDARDPEALLGNHVAVLVMTGSEHLLTQE